MPWWTALAAELRLPAGVTGPRESFPLAWEASLRLRVLIAITE